MSITNSTDLPKFAAAVDLGSNSFHMIIVRLEEGSVTVVDRLRERVRIAAGLEDGVLNKKAQQRAFRCLEKFGQRLREFSSETVRAVGTNTFRRARNANEFRREAELALGHPIEIISGGEEARLIDLGVRCTHPVPSERRLLIDIGGGSTELIIGEDEHLIATESLPLGCVSWSQEFFPNGVIDEDRYREALTAARLELRPIQERFRKLGWEFALGSSGTAHAIQSLIRSLGRASAPVTRHGLLRLREEIFNAGHIDAIQIPELKEDRRPVLPGGIAIMHAVFKSMKISELTAASGGLREGILEDLLGRLGNHDIRETTISAFLKRYQVDVDQADRVRQTCAELLGSVSTVWNLGAEAQLPLLWAAQLHEIGLAIAHNGHQKHAEYLLRHADMPGFSTDDQEMIAVLVRSHRRSLSKSRFEGLPHLDVETGFRLSLLLRLAVILNRERRDEAFPGLKIKAKSKRLEIQLPTNFKETHPLTSAELQAEAKGCKNWGVEIRLTEQSNSE